MKPSLFLLLLCALIGCAPHHDELPPVPGDREPVNSPAIIQEVTANV